MKTILFIACLLISGFSIGQNSYAPFFPELTHWYEMDSMTTEQVTRMVKKHVNDFNQVMFNYGSDDPKDWQYVSDYVLEYPEIGVPFVNKLDLNEDGIEDIILSMHGGEMYGNTGVYLGQKKGYKNILYKKGIFLGQYKNGDLCYQIPACCSDPRSEFRRYRLGANDKMVLMDSMAIAAFHPFYRDSTGDAFKALEWSITEDTLYATIFNPSLETFGGYLPGAHIRIIKRDTVGKEELLFCEVKGTPLPQERYPMVFPHSFLWLGTNDENKYR